MVRGSVVAVVVILSSRAAHASCEELWPDPVLVHDLDDVEVVAHHVDGIVPGPTHTLVRFRTEIRSTAGAEYVDLRASIARTGPLGRVSVDRGLTFARVLADTPTLSDDTWSVRVPNAQLASVNLALSLTPPTVRFPEAVEVPVFEGTHTMDAATDAVWAHEGNIDGDLVHWFSDWTDLLLAIDAGDTVMPSPCTATWCPEPAYTPSAFAECADFPLHVREVVQGDGQNTGLVGEVGLRLDAAATMPLLVSGRILADLDPDSFPGPYDSWQDPLTDLDDTGVACQGAPIADADGNITDCAFTWSMYRFNLEPHPGVTLQGAVSWPRFDGQVEIEVRDGEPTFVHVQGDVSLDSALAFDAVYNGDLERTEIDLVPEGTLHVVLLSVPIGPGELELAADARLYVGYEGYFDAEAHWGNVQRDSFIVDVTWTPQDGMTLGGSHASEPLPGSDPRLDLVLEGSITGFAGMVLDLAMTESLTGSSVLAHAECEVDATLAIDAFASPLWTFESSGELLASADAEFLYGLLGPYSLAEVELDAWVGLAGFDASGDDLGQDTRWARALDVSPTTTTTKTRALAPTDDGGVVWAGPTGFTQGAIARLSAEGDLDWAKTLPSPWQEPQALAVLPDGRIAAAANKCAAIAIFASDGTVEWAADLSSAGATFTMLNAGCAVAPHTDGSGTSGFLVATGVSIGGTTRPVLAFFADDGTLVWSRHYNIGSASGFYDVAGDVDGNIYVSGFTNSVAHLLDDTDGIWPSDTSNGHVIALDRDGSVRWGTVVNSEALTGVARAGDHVYATGSSSVYAYGTWHGFALAAFDAGSGALRWYTTYAEDVVFESRPDQPNTNAPGDTVWDRGLRIAPLGVADDLVLTGTTALGTQSGPWLMRVTGEGQPVWSWIHDGPGEDAGGELGVRGDAIFVATTSGGLGAALGTADSAVATVQKHPLDGGLRFDESLGFDDRSLQPQVEDRRGLQVQYINHEGGLSLAPSRIDFPLTVTPRVLTPTAATPTLSPID